jgi:dienelactone hydrolase
MVDRLVLALLAALAASAPAALRAQALPGTTPWEDRGDPAAAMVAGIGRFLDRELAASVERRREKWRRDFSSPEAYVRSVEPNRRRFQGILGAVDPRIGPVEMAYVATTDVSAKRAETPAWTAFTVRWGVYDDVEAEGLLLEPKGEAKANVVVLGDADASPEMLAGLAPGLEPHAQVARLLAEAGCRVLAPTLIDRSDAFSGNPRIRMTNQPHREWIYRMAYEVGRHPIGYEVDQIRAAVDWFTRPGQPRRPVGVVGDGEGGLLALDAAAVDTRIDAAWVAGYFGPRERVWQEPIYRNVWGLLEEFGDAEVAGLIAPRALLIEASRAPEVGGPPPPRPDRAGAAPGRVTTPAGAEVRAEFARALAFREKLAGAAPLLLIGDPDRPAAINAGDAGRRAFLAMLEIGVDGLSKPADSPPAAAGAQPHADPRHRQGRLVRQLVEHTQRLIRSSELRRDEYWSRADSSSPERWAETTEPYRRDFDEELIGRFPSATGPLNPKSVRLYDQPKWTGYGVQLDVVPDVVASGILLLPKGQAPGERRPVVVCQHGLEGRPEDVVDPRIQSVYHAFAARLADRGYVVYAPQNPYIGRDAFRILQRKANPLKRSLFSVIVRQHERTLAWLKTLPQVDPGRMAFYGLSYGGKTAMRVPALLKDYCLSICSGDFNEWVVKNTSTDRRYSYLFTGEYEMFEFGLAERFNYAEMAALIAPRPFQVERGHSDGVAPDEWIGYEFAKVKRLYDTLGLANRVDIAYFNGGHQIDGRGTFAFLARHLNWPGTPETSARPETGR